MKKMLTFLFLMFYSLIFSITIDTLDNQNYTGTFLSMNRALVFIKDHNNKIQKISLSMIKDMNFTREEKENMYFSLNNTYTFKGAFERIDGDYFIFKNDNAIFYIKNSDLKIVVVKKRVLSSYVATIFGEFRFNSIKIISDKLWKVSTNYGIIEIPSNYILSYFRPNLSSKNKNIVYFKNGDFLFYENIEIKNGLFIFKALDFSFYASAEDIIFLKSKNYIPQIDSFKEMYKLTINEKEFYTKSFKIVNNSLVFDNYSFKNPKIDFISRSIVNLFVSEDSFIGGISVNNNRIYVSAQSGLFYIFDFYGNLIKKFSLKSFAVDPPVIYKNKVFVSTIRKSLYVISNDSTITKFDFDTISAGVSIKSQNTLLLPTWYRGFFILDQNLKVLKSFDTKMSKFSSIIDHEGNIIFLDAYSNIMKLDKGFNILFSKQFGDEALTTYFNIDKDNNIYVNGPYVTFTVFDKNGNILWKVDLDDLPYSYPLIDKDKTVYVSSKGKYLYALKNGKILWKKYIGYIPGTGILTKNMIILNALDHNVYFIDKKTGNIIKKYHLGYSKMLCSDDNNIFFAGSNGVIAILYLNEDIISQYKFSCKHTNNPYIK
ncbi:PQQ-binding-like beta-propeller repeat protein [Marinitoga sp. 1138]|uniref:outer membrane protein assembly factor BamB family protein n=1 Tax=Marinitoga sp. 1138 TaxID=1643334 RepID=UPI001586EC35|nr:PQQ-binding-like beta-propeller repeat protein [Marinitoga sp. 1138]NUU96692.1 hypothetical protein [Marinitoga sp. 1138]